MTHAITIELSDEEIDAIAAIRADHDPEMSDSDAIHYAIRYCVCDCCGRTVYSKCYICDNDE